MKPNDITADPCGCGECIQADVTAERRRRDPRTGELLHGYALRRWLDAKADFMAKARAAVGERGRHAKGFERLATKEPE